MTNMYKSITKITLLFTFFLMLGIPKSQAQTENACVFVNVSFGEQKLYVFYGKDKVETISMKPETKMAAPELFYYMNNLMMETVNKLEKEGYKLSTSSTNTGTGTTLGYTLFFCRH